MIAATVSMARLPLSETTRHRARVASRVLAAALGGYAVMALATAVLALLLPRLGGTRAEGVLTASMLSFVCYASAVMWAFATRSATRAWFGLGALALCLGAALWLLRSFT